MSRAVQTIARTVVICSLMAVVVSAAFAQQTTEISATPSSLSFSNEYINTVSGSKVITINNLTTSGTITIETATFSCPGFGLASGVVPFQMGQFQKITHYSIFFQPTLVQAYSCNFVLTLQDGTYLDVPLTGTGLTTTATNSLTTTVMNFSSQSVGTTSAPQTVTINNTGGSSITLEGITPSSPSFTTSPVTLPYTIGKVSSLSIQVYYTPNQVGFEAGALDLSYNSLPDNGVTLNGTAVAASSLAITNNPVLPQATQGYAYQAQFNAAGGVGPYTYALTSGSSLPTGLSLSSSGEITGTVASSVATGNYTFTVQVTDNSNGTSASTLYTIGVFAYLGDNCNDLSFNVVNSDPPTPEVAITDLGTGTYQGYEAGLYPNGSNVRPAAQDSYGVGLANAIVPLNGSGQSDPTGKYVFMAVGESTLQNEFNSLLPIANADPAKNLNLVIVNGAQGGATPNNLTTTSSVYWNMVINNYLPQNGVTQNQVVAIFMEDTDGIATGTFPTDISNLQSEYETVMNTMLTLFPNLKMVYFSSRVYGGFSNGVGTPDNPEPYSYEVGYAVKWAIGDQLNGNANLNYNPSLGPVVAPWMSWGTYYWSNGMLGRKDGLVWDCEDFSPDGTHPSIFYGQPKVATRILQFLKTDDTTTPWYLVANYALTATGGNNQTGNVGTALPTPLTVLASNLNSGVGTSGVAVAFTDNGAGGSFSNPNPVTGSNGSASTTYTLPTTAKTVNISATSTGYTSTSFTETATTFALAATAGNNQSGLVGTTLPTALTVTATSGGNPVAGVSVSFTDNGAGGTFGTPTGVTGSNGTASTTYTLPSAAQTVTIIASSSGYSSATFTETATTNKSLAADGGNNQTGGAGTTLPTALTVLATNGGTPVSGVSVTFTDNGAGGTFGTPTGTTNGSGTASTTYTLPSTAKTVTINATSTGYTAATFTEISALDTIAATSGNNQTGTIGTTLPVTLTATATSNGTAVAGVSVTFSDGGKGGTFGAPTGVTNSSGTVSTTYTLPPSTAQTVTITAAASGYTSATFTETSTLPVLTATGGNNQTGSEGAVLPTALTVTASTTVGTVSGVTVTFSDSGAHGVFSSPTGVTGSGGTVSTTYTPAISGTITITATSSGYTPATFTETSTQVVTSVTVVSGAKQTGTVGTTLPLPIVFKAKNSAGKAVAGVAITYSDNGLGGTFSPNPAITGTNGEASSTFTLPTSPHTIAVNGANGTASVNATEFSVVGAAAQLKTVSGGGQSANPNTKLAKPLVVSVQDKYGNPISGVTVTFTDNGAGGTFSTTTPVTGTNGQASTTYTTGSKAGSVTISATTSTLGPVKFTELVK